MRAHVKGPLPVVAAVDAAVVLVGGSTAGLVRHGAAKPIAVPSEATTTPAADTRRPVVLTDLREILVDVGGDGLNVRLGSATPHTPEIRNAAGHVIGHASGTVRVPAKLPTGHGLLTVHEKVAVDRNSLQARGAFAFTAILAHDWVSLRVVGTGGRFVGRTGSRQFQVVRDPVPWRASITMFS